MKFEEERMHFFQIKTRTGSIIYKIIKIDKGIKQKVIKKGTIFLWKSNNFNDKNIRRSASLYLVFFKNFL